MFCVKCGKQIADEARFCTGCGAATHQEGEIGLRTESIHKELKSNKSKMGLKDILNISKIKAENENLKSLMTPELQEASNLLAKIEELKQTQTQLQSSINK